MAGLVRKLIESLIYRQQTIYWYIGFLPKLLFYKLYLNNSVLWIRDILVRIRVRIRIRIFFVSDLQDANKGYFVIIFRRYVNVIL